MNVLLVNPPFPESFWSLSQAARAQMRRCCFPPLGLVTMAALLPGHWRLRLVDQNARTIKEADWRWSDLVLSGGMAAQRDGLVDLAAQARRRQVPMAAGGPSAHYFTGQLLDAGCTYVVRGEGEAVVPRLLQALDQGHGGGLIESAQRPDLAESPLPRFDLLRLGDYTTMSVQTSRGCPHRCDFCDVTNLFGRRQRIKPAPQVIGELEALFNLGWRGPVFICDDNFTANRSRTLELLQLLNQWMIERGKPFSYGTQASVELGSDQELIDEMTQAQFVNVVVGVETPDPEVLAACNKRQNLRHPVLEALVNLRDNGLSVIGTFIIGFDGEKPGAGGRIVDFVNRTSVPLVQLGVLNAPLGTPLYQRLEDQGRIIPETRSSDAFYGETNFIPQRPYQEIADEFVEAWRRLYDRKAFIERCEAFYLAMRPTRQALALSQGRQPPPEVIPAKMPLSTKARNLVSILHFLWWYTVRTRPAARRRLVKAIWRIKKRNPSRLTSFVNALFMAESMFMHRRRLLRAAARGELKGPRPDQAPQRHSPGPATPTG